MHVHLARLIEPTSRILPHFERVGKSEGNGPIIFRRATLGFSAFRNAEAGRKLVPHPSFACRHLDYLGAEIRIFIEHV